jgi:predicted DNA-binding transcriptional regulator AlpA
MLPADDDAYVRLPTVLGVFPVGETTWWAGVAAGRFPKPVKLSPRVIAWRVGDVRALLASLRKLQ